MPTRRASKCSVSHYFCIAKAHGLEVPADMRDDQALPFVSIPSEALDEAVWDRVSAVLERPEYLDETIARLEADDHADLNTTALLAHRVQVRIDMDIYASAIASVGSPQVLALLTAKLAELESTLDEIELQCDRVRQRGQKHALARAHIASLKALYADERSTGSTMTYEMKRRTLTILGVQVYVDPRRLRRNQAMPTFRIEASIPLEVPAEK